MAFPIIGVDGEPRCQPASFFDRIETMAIESAIVLIAPSVGGNSGNKSMIRPTGRLSADCRERRKIDLAGMRGAKSRREFQKEFRLANTARSIKHYSAIAIKQHRRKARERFWHVTRPCDFR